MIKVWTLFCALGFFLGGIAAFLMWPRTYTELGGNTYFPPNATWQTARYAVGITVHGALGKNYSDFGDKQVFVVIYHNQSPILQKEYVIKAGDLEWKVNWKQLSSVEINFSDSDTGSGGKIIQTIDFRIDSSTGKIVESK